MKRTNENPCVKFGAFVKAARIARWALARDVAFAAEMLPSNFSKMEHGVLRPPRDAESQKRIALALGISEGSAEEYQFFDLAAAAIGSTPVDVAEIISRDEALPLLLRVIGQKRLNKDGVERLVNLVRETA